MFFFKSCRAIVVILLIPADSVLVNAGADIGNYWFRATISDMYTATGTTIENGVDFNVLGIWRYAGAPKTDPEAEFISDKTPLDVYHLGELNGLKLAQVPDYSQSLYLCVSRTSSKYIKNSTFCFRNECTILDSKLMQFPKRMHNTGLEAVWSRTRCLTESIYDYQEDASDSSTDRAQSDDGMAVATDHDSFPSTRAYQSAISAGWTVFSYYKKEKQFPQIQPDGRNFRFKDIKGMEIQLFSTCDTGLDNSRLNNPLNTRKALERRKVDIESFLYSLAASITQRSSLSQAEACDFVLRIAVEGQVSGATAGVRLSSAQSLGSIRTKFDAVGKAYSYNHQFQITRRCSYFAQNLYGNLNEEARAAQDLWLHQHVDMDKADLVRQSRELADEESLNVGIKREGKYSRIWKAKFDGQAQDERERFMNTPSQVRKNRGKYKVPRDVRVWTEEEALEHARKLDNCCSSLGVSLEDGASIVYDK
ncbi:hypothetical protein HDU78_000150 [Chytriomyces hyalinus]|nr:hypothetical protein HDU78_000150 [Chytriomyces hyalinus]